MNLSYDWSKYPNIEKLLKRVYDNTIKVLKVCHKDENYAQEFITDIEEYLNYFKENNYNLDIITSKLESLIFVSFIDDILRKEGNITYLTQEMVTVSSGAIFLNNNIPATERLTAREHRRLLLYKGLSKIIVNLKNTKTHEFSKLYSDLAENEADYTLLADGGWTLIQEVLSQELAEEITYKTLNKDRPGIRVGIESNDYYPINGSKVSSRLEQYRPFEELVVAFGGTLSGVGSIMDYSHDKMMQDMINKAINTNFGDAIVSQYVYYNNELELYIMLVNMGKLLNEKYATYGKRIVKSSELSQNEINTLYDDILNSCSIQFTLDEDIYEKVPIKEVNKNIFIENRIKKMK